MTQADPVVEADRRTLDLPLINEESTQEMGLLTEKGIKRKGSGGRRLNTDRKVANSWKEGNIHENSLARICRK